MNIFKEKGLTVFELLVSISILSLISAFAFASVQNSRDNAYESLTRAQMKQVENALEFYLDENDGEYPEDVGRGETPDFVSSLGAGIWPVGAWPGSSYDWDNWDYNALDHPPNDPGGSCISSKYTFLSKR